MPRFSAPILIVLALASLWACATPDPVMKPCPSYGILHDAENLSAFGQGVQDASNIMYRVTLARPALDCHYHGYKTSSRGRRSVPTPGINEYAPPGDNDLVGPRSDLLTPTQEEACLFGQSSERSKKFGHVSGTMKFDVVIDAGPAMTDRRVTVPYFVAITRAKKFILAREEFTATIKVAGQQTTQTIEVPLDIPLASNTTGASYEVITGLVLTPEQLAYNRQHAAR